MPKRSLTTFSPGNPYRQRRLERQANRLLAKSGFFQKPVAEVDQGVLALLLKSGLTDAEAAALAAKVAKNEAKADANAISPAGHLRATWTGKVQPTDILTR